MQVSSTRGCNLGESETIPFRRVIDRRQAIQAGAGIALGASLQGEWSVVAQDINEAVGNSPLREIADDRGVTFSTYFQSFDFRADADILEVIRSEFNGIIDASYGWNFGINRSPGYPYSFRTPDERQRFAEEYNQRLMGCHLAFGWPTRIPDHVLQAGYSPEQLMVVLAEHVRTVVEHGKGKVHVWGAVNEAIDHNGNFKQGDFLVKNSPWSNGIYPDYIPVTLQAAHEADPEAILLVTDWDNDTYTDVSGNTNLKTEGHFALIANLLEDPLLRGAGFDFSKLGVGMQMHIFDAAVDYSSESVTALKAEQLQSNIARYRTELGRSVHLTEMDVKIHGLSGDLRPKYDHQAVIYRYVVRAALAAGVRNIGLFGATDSAHLDNFQQGDGTGSGGPTSDPTLFDDNQQPKPAYFAVKEEIAKLPVVE